MSETAQFESQQFARIASYEDDQRWQTILRGVLQLTGEAIDRLDDHIGSGGDLVLDSMNYDPNTGLWCPLAIAVDTPALVVSGHSKVRSGRDARAAMREAAQLSHPDFSINPVSGIAGEAYTADRWSDLTLAMGVVRAFRRQASTLDSEPVDTTLGAKEITEAAREAAALAEV